MSTCAPASRRRANKHLERDKTAEALADYTAAIELVDVPDAQRAEDDFVRIEIEAAGSQRGSTA
jgi:hypothetical protein